MKRVKKVHLFIFGIVIIVVGICFSFFYNRNLFNKKEMLVKESIIEKGDSFYEILSQTNLYPSQILEASACFSQIYDPKSFKVNDKYKLIYSTSGDFDSFYYFPDVFNYYNLKISSNGFVASKGTIEFNIEKRGGAGIIKSSLYESMLDLGISSEIIMQFADIFSWDIDFFTDIWEDDKFKLIWEVYVNKNGEIIKEGKILVAQYEGKKTGLHTGILFEKSPGKFDYYDVDGKSLRKQFLKAPLNFRRISSYFSHKRFHPILKYYRPHLGIDYAAPRGTPVVSIGDGEVIFAGWKNGFGNQVIIRHNSAYTTYYGHLLRFGKGIKKGRKVKQGEVIGYVGSTGLATGPHLDFRITKNGKFVNFLQLKFPPIDNIKEAQKGEFEQVKLNYLRDLTKIEKFEEIVKINLETPEKIPWWKRIFKG